MLQSFTSYVEVEPTGTVFGLQRLILTLKSNKRRGEGHSHLIRSSLHLRTKCQNPVKGTMNVGLVTHIRNDEVGASGLVSRKLPSHCPFTQCWSRDMDSILMPGPSPTLLGRRKRRCPNKFYNNNRDVVTRAFLQSQFSKHVRGTLITIPTHGSRGKI